jgi:hypothetical protein
MYISIVPFEASLAYDGPGSEADNPAKRRDEITIEADECRINTGRIAKARFRELQDSWTSPFNLEEKTPDPVPVIFLNLSAERGDNGFLLHACHVWLLNNNGKTINHYST